MRRSPANSTAALLSRSNIVVRLCLLRETFYLQGPLLNVPGLVTIEREVERILVKIHVHYHFDKKAIHDFLQSTKHRVIYSRVLTVLTSSPI